MSLRTELDAAGIQGQALRAGYARCRALAARHGRTYYLATLLLPPAKRPFVHALYGLARHTDDLVDETPGLADEVRTERLDAWTAEFLHDLDWGTAGDPIARAAVDTARRWQIPATYFADFFTAMRRDLTVTGYDTEAELAEYMWGSAAVIGLQLLPILGRAEESVRWDRLEPHAIELGLAFQLTNFLRDVAEDLRRGRVYLPRQTLSRFGVDRERLDRALAAASGHRGVRAVTGRRRGGELDDVDEPLRNLLAHEIERARRHYAAAEPGIALLHPSSQDCVRTALTLYSGILDEIEQADYDVFSRRAQVGIVRRARVGAAGLAAARRAR